ncbi:MAG: biopolymer transporter ExbD [Polyangia bacterium]|jgi:biopolymer transport protein ExbD
MGFAPQGESEEVMSEINVTPLVDVMLVLLVVFLVTAPLLANTIRVNLPQTAKTSGNNQEPKKSINLSIAADGKVYIDKREIDLVTVEAELRTLKTAYPDLIVHLNADKDINYGLVAKTMSSADRAGITRLSVLTVSE